MNISQYIRRLYSLETLDTRFTSSRSKDSGAAQHPTISVNGTRNSVSLWATTEFYVYYVIFLVAIPLMFKAANEVSNPSHSNYSKFEPLLSTGWIVGRKVDNSDSQYASFRDNIPYMLILLILHPLLRRIYGYFYQLRQSSSSVAKRTTKEVLRAPHTHADTRLDQRVTFDVFFGVVYIVILHGVSAAKVSLILYVNFLLATRLSRRHVAAATWVFNIGILFANEFGRGYPFATIAEFLLPWSDSIEKVEGRPQATWGAMLDSYGGLIPRWEILFKIAILRMISFNFDYCWSSNRAGDNPLEKKQLDPADFSDRDRVSIPASSRDYSFRNYLAYVLYAPLYLTGPILTFNEFIYQMKYPMKSISPTRTIFYGLRFLICLLAMEFMLHFIYAVAISKAQPDWKTYTTFQISMLSYFNLHIIWLKLLLPWRFFRLWALVDGVDPPENMVRCMSNNYSAFAFWRGWHRSYNRWIVRYLYIPLGGSGTLNARGPAAKARAVANLLVVFTFVALWHDINLTLLMWSWLITLFVLPEAVAEYLFPRKKWSDQPQIYRIICGVGAVGNVLMMMAANLVGFAVGLDGLKGLVNSIFGSYSGIVFLLVACGALFTGVQVMFEIREDELRQGIRMKC